MLVKKLLELTEAGYEVITYKDIPHIFNMQLRKDRKQITWTLDLSLLNYSIGGIEDEVCCILDRMKKQMEAVR